jgi:hypothetical protein
VRAEFFVALIQAFGHRQRQDLFKVLEQMGLKIQGRAHGVRMRAAEGFGHHLIHQIEMQQILGGDFQRRRGLGGVGAVLPQNGRAAFGADDRVIGVLQNQDAVGHANAQRAAGAAFADDGGDDGHFEQGHFPQVDGNGLGDVAFLCCHAGVRARRVNERDDGQAEFMRHAHQPERLPITFGMRGAEIAQDVFLGVPAFLRADDHDPVLAQLGKAADHGVILGKHAVAMQFLEIREGLAAIIQRVGPLGMARQLHALPGIEVQENLPAGLLDFLLDDLDFLLEADAERMFLRMRPQVFQLVLQFGDRLFEIELMLHALEILTGFKA